jgi:oligoribonuclease NrnB/cAMP/cGMP phosphodiesterase (DHH superfamily)
MNPLVIYHKGCIDGQGAAIAALAKHPNAELFPGVYSEVPPTVEGREVYLVDFSYPLTVLKEILQTAKHVTIIDHHKTAIDELQDYFNPKLTKVMTNDHSGAVLAWKFFHPDVEVPQMLIHIEDRDLWKFVYGDTTKAITAYLYSLDFETSYWLQMLDPHFWTRNFGVFIVAGETLVRQEAKRTKSLAQNPRWLHIGGHNVPAVNCNAYYASEVGHELDQDVPFAATYYDTVDGRVFSLRSAKDGKDVGAIAKSYGGGGHFHAAGFTVTRQQVIENGWV